MFWNLSVQQTCSHKAVRGLIEAMDRGTNPGTKLEPKELALAFLSNSPASDFPHLWWVIICQTYNTFHVSSRARSQCKDVYASSEKPSVRHTMKHKISTEAWGNYYKRHILLSSSYHIPSSTKHSVSNLATYIVLILHSLLNSTTISPKQWSSQPPFSCLPSPSLLVQLPATLSLNEIQPVVKNLRYVRAVTRTAASHTNASALLLERLVCAKSRWYLSIRQFVKNSSKRYKARCRLVFHRVGAHPFALDRSLVWISTDVVWIVLCCSDKECLKGQECRLQADTGSVGVCT